MTIQFSRPVDPSVFTRLDSVTEAETRNNGTVLALTVKGEMDDVVKTAATEEVVSISTRADELEEVFLSYYSGAIDAS